MSEVPIKESCPYQISIFRRVEAIINGRYIHVIALANINEMKELINLNFEDDGAGSAN